MDQGYQPSTQSRFNSSGDILNTIGILKYNAIEKHRAGDLEGWFNEWKEIKLLLVGRMETDKNTAGENKKLIRLEAKIDFMLKKNWEEEEGYRKIVIRLIEVYLTKLQIMIEGWGMGLVNKEDESIFA